MIRHNLALHSFIFATFFVVRLYSVNPSQVAMDDFWKLLGIVLVATLCLFIFFLLVIRDSVKAVVITSIFLVWFFSYGYIHEEISKFTVMGRHRFLLPVSLGLIFTLVWIVLRFKKWIQNVHNMLNAMSSVMLVLGIFPLFVYHIRSERQLELPVVDFAKSGINNYIETRRTLPDIYFILLDEYARTDVLSDLFCYNNSDFLASLQSNGFYVVEKSRSNYSVTQFSLASVLNMTYLDNLTTKMSAGSQDLAPVISMIKRNQFFSFLKSRGYKIVSFVAKYSSLEIENVDHYIECNRTLSEFAEMLIRTTPLRVFLYSKFLLKGGLYSSDRNRIRNTLEYLVKMPDLREKLGTPILIFAYFSCPHVPFVFDKEGREISPLMDFYQPGQWDLINREEYKKYYIGQLQFISDKILNVVETIIKQSVVPPIIMLVSDHGTALQVYWSDPLKSNTKERVANFEACYFPGGGSNLLYKDVTLINLPRIILKYYFRQEIDLLPDKSYFQTSSEPYQFLPVH